MSTRSITILNDEDGKEIAVVYRHSDGYPSAHGADLKALLAGRKLGNGIRIIDGATSTDFNGAEDLAARLIVGLKIRLHERSVAVGKRFSLPVARTPQDDPGSIYLYPAGTRDIGESFVYTVSPVVSIEDGESFVHLEVVRRYESKILFRGSIDIFNPDVKTWEE